MSTIYISDQIPTELQQNLPSEVTYFTSRTISSNQKSTVEGVWGWDATAQSILDTSGNQLKWIQSFSAGVDYFPLEDLKQHDVTLANTSGAHGTTIAQTVLMYALYFARDFNQNIKMQQSKKWQPLNDLSQFSNLQTLTNKTWLIFGTGHIGSKIAELAKATGGATIGVNHSGHATDNFDETIAITAFKTHVKQADIIVNILPLTKATTHLFNSNFFNQLTSLFLFINVGRGQSVDTDALEIALDNGVVRHAALDVFEKEPLPSNHPLWNYEQVLITPHSSAISDEMLHNVKNIFVNNVKSYLEYGKITEHLVNLSNGY